MDVYDDDEEEDLADESGSNGSSSIIAKAAKQVPNPNLTGLDLKVVSIALYIFIIFLCYNSNFDNII